jgi:cobalamin biosynthesis protein CobW
MKNQGKIPATVITGFLGAGKTTLVRHLLENANGRRIALIVNEFGDLGIDAGLIEGCGIPSCREEDVIELANGCICCTVADEFLPTMEALLARPQPPDHIVIETSGLALPKPLVKAFQWPDIRSRVTVDGVVTVVDAAALAAGRFSDQEEEQAPDHDNPLEEVFEDQLLCADIVLVNKTDLLTEGGLAAVRAELSAKLRKGVRTLPSQRGAIDPAILFGLDAAAEDDLAVRPSHHDGEEEHDHQDFESFVLDLPADIDPALLETRLKAAIETHDILRAKGFVSVPGKPARHVIQAAGPRIERYFDRPWRPGEDRAGRLVIIGLFGLDREAIAAMLRGA